MWTTFTIPKGPLMSFKEHFELWEGRAYTGIALDVTSGGEEFPCVIITEPKTRSGQ